MRGKKLLSYGADGTGKTALQVSSFWDFVRERPVEGETGRLLLIGQESNEDLGVPEEMVRRFIPPANDPIQFIDKFQKYLRQLAAAAKKGEGPSNIVVDGFSELCYVFEHSYAESNEPKDKWESWREWRSEFIGAIQLLNPEVMGGAWIFGTARVAEFKRGTELKGKVVGKDPDWMGKDYEYYPAMDGWAKYNLGHYFNYVVYHETSSRTKVEGGKSYQEPVYQVHWMPFGQYHVKNTMSHKWGRTGLGPVTENMQWPEIKAKLGEAEKGVKEDVPS